jgi:uncharacterized protein (TIGR02284 family)
LVRSALAGADFNALLCEAERGETFIEDAYESALIETAGSALNDVLLKHYGEIGQAHDRICEVRDKLETI